MEEQYTTFALEQQVFCAPTDCVEVSAQESFPKFFRHRPAQLRFAHDHSNNLPFEYMALHAPARSFHFGKFGQIILRLLKFSVCHSYNVTSPECTVR